MLLYMCLLIGSLLASNLQQEEPPLKKSRYLSDEQISFVDMPSYINSQIISYLNKEDKKNLSYISSNFLLLVKKNVEEIEIQQIEGIVEQNLINLFLKLPSLKRIKLNSLRNENFLNAILSHSKNIHKFDLRECTYITDNALKKLSSFENLTHLNLFFSFRVTNASLEGLPTNLTHLDLSYCNITDAGLEHLHRLKSLQFVDLTRCRVTKQEMQKLNNNLPNLTIQRQLNIKDLMNIH